MAKDYDTILKQFNEELKENDKKVQVEIKSKSRTEMSKEFENFIKTNKCKIKDKKAGGKNDKK